jgi:alpha-amylase
LRRWNEFTEMAKFRQFVGASGVNDWWDNGANAIGFGRGDAGYVAINAEHSGLTRTFQTSLPAGAYCDVIDGGLQGGQCGGRTIQVDGDGRFTASLPAGSALALHGGARPGSTAEGCVEVTVTATTWWGQEVYITGNRPELGNWQPAPDGHLSPVNYPQWTGTVSVPAGTTFEYKYIKQNPNGDVEWESGANRVATVPSQGCLTLQDTWRD